MNYHDDQGDERAPWEIRLAIQDDRAEARNIYLHGFPSKRWRRSARLLNFLLYYGDYRVGIPPFGPNNRARYLAIREIFDRHGISVPHQFNAELRRIIDYKSDRAVPPLFMSPVVQETLSFVHCFAAKYGRYPESYEVVGRLQCSTANAKVAIDHYRSLSDDEKTLITPCDLFLEQEAYIEIHGYSIQVPERKTTEGASSNRKQLRLVK